MELTSLYEHELVVQVVDNIYGLELELRGDHSVEVRIALVLNDYIRRNWGNDFEDRSRAQQPRASTTHGIPGDGSAF